MIEYLLMAVYLLTIYLLFRNRYLQSKKWFAIAGIALTIGIIIYLILDSRSDWNAKKVVLVILIVGSVTLTLMKRAGVFSQKK